MTEYQLYTNTGGSLEGSGQRRPLTKYVEISNLKSV